MTQIGFPEGKAHEALDAFLADQAERWVAGSDGEPVAWIMPAARHDDLMRGYVAWGEAQEVAGEDADLPPGYRPWRHSPLATTERLLPTEPLHEPLARMMFEKAYEALGEDAQWRVRATAIMCLLRVTLDPDGQGAVPILAAGHDPDEPGNGMRWQLAFTTAVPGLFTRMTGNGFTGEEWSVITGSGWIIRQGYVSRQLAIIACEALGRVLPNTDWMRLTPDAFTPAALQAIRSVLRRHQTWGTDDQAPAPEPMTDAVPAAPQPGCPGVTA